MDQLESIEVKTALSSFDNNSATAGTARQTGPIKAIDKAKMTSRESFVPSTAFNSQLKSPRDDQVNKKKVMLNVGQSQVASNGRSFTADLPDFHSKEPVTPTPKAEKNNVVFTKR